MHPFEYHPAHSMDDATSRLAESGAMVLGGGTDLLVQLKEQLVRPTLLVDIRRVRGSDEVVDDGAGGVRIGAAARLTDLAGHPRIRSDFPLLAEACDSVGTPALRNMGTLAGNLCQRPRCWYYRRAIPCHKNGGDNCPAVAGENQYHAIFGGGPCFIVHPSDPAVALTALGARIEVRGAAATRTLPIAEFFVPPSVRLDGETVLAAGEFVSAIVLPGESAGGVQHYEKLMQRGTWDFALVSLAAAKRRDGDVRLVLGGVAPTPWRVTDSVEEDIASGSLDPNDIDTLAERALYDARPLTKNGYKVQLAAALLQRAIVRLSGLGPRINAEERG